jgi:hypothetical protein
MTDLTFQIKKGDTYKPLSLHLKYKTSTGTSAVDLSNATAVFYMRLRNAKTNKVDGSACSITGATSGYLQYAWADADVNTAGIYDGEVVVTFSDGSEETFPEDDDYIRIVIEEDMA